MNFETFSLNYFVIRVVIGFWGTVICLLLFRPENKSQRIGYAIMGALPSVLAVGVSPEQKFSCCIAGVVYGVLAIIFGLLFVKFEQPKTEPLDQTPAEVERTN